MTQPPAGSLSAQGGRGERHPSAESLEGLIERLKQKMEQNPNDGVGWALLARSYMGWGVTPRPLGIRESHDTDS